MLVVKPVEDFTTKNNRLAGRTVRVLGLQRVPRDLKTDNSVTVGKYA